MATAPRLGLRESLTAPFRTASHREGEDGQARLRFLGSVVIGTLYLIAHLSGAFGELTAGLQGIVIYGTYGYLWCIVVAHRPFSDEQRRILCICLDHSIFGYVLYASQGDLVPLVFLPISISLGNGLRYGQKLGMISSVIGFACCATAMLLNPSYRSVIEVMVGLLLAILLVPMYGVALNLKLQALAKAAQQRADVLEEVNRTDPLTGLANRVGLLRVLTRLVEDGRDVAVQGAVYYLDLDGFKKVNDTAGHEAGDQVLIDVAVALRKAVRSSDLVARLGGDEFAIVVRGMASRRDALSLGENILTAVQAIRIAGHPGLRVGTSIGACLLPHEKVCNPDDALNVADHLMYQAKQAGKAQIRVSG